MLKFAKSHISADIFKRIDGRSYGRGCDVPLSELAYISVPHYNFYGKAVMGEMICNMSIADDLLDIFKGLFDAKYPIERMALIDEYDADDGRSMSDNNSCCFNYRRISGTDRLSKHAFGMAVDINPLYNPYVGRGMILPPEGEAYADRSKKFDYKIDNRDLCYKLFVSHGFTWGGDWGSLKDYQHFEK